MLGRDFDGSMKEARDVARYLAFQQLNQIQDALFQVLGRVSHESPVLIAAGCGRFLVHRLARAMGLECLDFADLFRCDESLKDPLNVCAPAAALAELGAAKLCR